MKKNHVYKLQISAVALFHAMTINTFSAQLISSIRYLSTSSLRTKSSPEEKKTRKDENDPFQKAMRLLKDEQGRPRRVNSPASQVLDLQKASRSRLDFSSFSSVVIVSTYEDFPIESHDRKQFG